MSDSGETFDIAFARVLRRSSDGGWEAVAWIEGERTTRRFGRRDDAEAWLRSLPPAVGPVDRPSIDESEAAG